MLPNTVGFWVAVKEVSLSYHNPGVPLRVFVFL